MSVVRCDNCEWLFELENYRYAECCSAECLKEYKENPKVVLSDNTDMVVLSDNDS